MCKHLLASEWHKNNYKTCSVHLEKSSLCPFHRCDKHLMQKDHSLKMLRYSDGSRISFPSRQFIKTGIGLTRIYDLWHSSRSGLARFLILVHTRMEMPVQTFLANQSHILNTCPFAKWKIISMSFIALLQTFKYEVR